MKWIICFFVFCNSLLFWQSVYSDQFADCHLSQGFGNNSVFVDIKNRTITDFIVQKNFTFGIIPGSRSNLNALFALVCVDLVSSVCSDYIGPCPRSAFLFSIVPPFISITNYRNASSKYKIIHNELVLLLYFPSNNF